MNSKQKIFLIICRFCVSFSLWCTTCGHIISVRNLNAVIYLHTNIQIYCHHLFNLRFTRTEIYALLAAVAFSVKSLQNKIFWFLCSILIYPKILFFLEVVAPINLVFCSEVILNLNFYIYSLYYFIIFYSLFLSSYFFTSSWSSSSVFLTSVRLSKKAYEIQKQKKVFSLVLQIKSSLFSDYLWFS
jgi:hypothetical protein